MNPSIEEIEFIACSTHRVGVLETLTEGGCDRAELIARTGAHTSTIGRVLSDFEDRRWIERNGPTYQLTPLGEFVAKQFAALYDAMETERKLRDVWQWLPREMEGFSADLFADAVLAYPPSGYPYEPVERVVELVEKSDSIRAFGATVFKAVANETFCREALDGMDVEIIYSPAVLAATIQWNPDLFEKAAAQDQCTILVHEDLPDRSRCGIDIFDQRVAICCHDSDTKALRGWIDTDAPEARSWARSVYQQYRREAQPLDEADLDTSVPEHFTTP